ncbi:MAG: hypothetical protein ACRDJM_03150 [Actinomycetota bacterium]
MPALIILFIVAVGAIAYGSWYLRKKRREAVAALAARLGMNYDQGDPFALDETLPHRLFSLGEGRDCENVIWGTWQGLPVCAFDYWYYTTSTDSEGHTSRTYHRFSCATVRVALDCAPLLVTGENLFTRLADGLGFHDIEFELEEFNRAWQVKCPDPKFANDFIDQRMMAWLMHAGTGWSFEVAGPVALAYCKKMSTAEIPTLLACAKQFCERIPRVVADLYPAPGGPAQAGS